MNQRGSVYGSAVAASLIVVALELGCRNQTSAASPDAAPMPAAVASDASVERSDASVLNADASVSASDGEPATKPFACDDALFVVGREWIEARTTSATATGSGGYVGQVWRGTKSKELRLQKKILAMRGDAITRMRVAVLVNRDSDTPDVEPEAGRSFVVTSDAPSDAPIAELTREMTSPRWRGDARALAETLRIALRWSVNDPRKGDSPDEGHPWGAGTLTPAPARKTQYGDSQAFTVAGNALDAFVGLGHRAEFRIRVSGTLVVSADGALLESQLTTRSTVVERTLALGGPWSTTATTTTVESFRVQCSSK